MARKNRKREHPAKSPNLGDLLRANRSVVRFVLTAVGGILVFFFVTRLGWVQAGFVEPYTEFVATCTWALLRILGVDAHQVGTIISSDRFAIRVIAECNALGVMAIFIAATLSFPTDWKRRLIGLAIGVPAIFLINLLRLVVLYFLGIYWPDVFESVHYYYAQAFVILSTVCLWLIWVTRISTPPYEPENP